MASRILTLATLVERRACEEHRLVFQGLFGNQVEVSVERFSRPDVVGARFDYDWGADLLMSEETRAEYYAAFREQRDKLKAEHQVGYYSAIPREVRDKLEAVLWAEFYVKDAPPPIEQPAAEEETADGNR